MGYTHGTTMNDEFRTCTQCGETLPNTREYFKWNNKSQITSAKCKKCCSKNNKERNLRMIEINKNKTLFYDGTKKCKTCGRDLPNNKLYFSIDLTCKSGLRNVCRECSPSEHGFLDLNYKVPEKWSDEDLNILKENYNHYTGRELQQLFFPNRTVRAIECEAGVLGFNTGKDERAKQVRSELQKEIAIKYIAYQPMSEEAKKKLSEFRREYYKTHDSWAKGIKLSPERCKQISERMKGKWSGEKNPRHINPLKGEDNGRWKGGINKTYFELRSDTKEWQQESMKLCDYKCVITGEGFDNVHHTTAFRDIVDEAFEITQIDIKEHVADYTTEDFNTLRNMCNVLHDIYGYGACINKDIHKLFHDTYGYTNFTPFDFLEFIYDIDSGKYMEWFNNNNYEIHINTKYVVYLEDIILNIKSA